MIRGLLRRLRRKPAEYSNVVDLLSHNNPTGPAAALRTAAAVEGFAVPRGERVTRRGAGPATPPGGDTSLDGDQQ